MIPLLKCAPEWLKRETGVDAALKKQEHSAEPNTAAGLGRSFHLLLIKIALMSAPWLRINPTRVRLSVRCFFIARKCTPEGAYWFSA